MATLRGGNRVKGMAFLLFMAAFGGVLLLVPLLRAPPASESWVDVPAMTNVPPAGSLHIEAQ